MKKFLQSLSFSTAILFILLSHTSQAVSCYSTTEDTNGAECTIDEIIVTPTPQPNYYPGWTFPDIQPSYPSTPAPVEQPNPCQAVATQFSACGREANSIYVSAIRACRLAAFGGGAIGSAAFGFASMLGRTPWGGVMIVTGGAGTGAGIWGSSSCYSDADAIRGLNNAICENNRAQTLAACGQ